jgi:hypothetical protein
MGAYGAGFGIYKGGTSGGGAVAITNTRIPRGTGTTIEDGTWDNIGNDLIPVTNGSKIGNDTNRIGNLFLTSSIDFNSSVLLIKKSGSNALGISTTDLLVYGGRDIQFTTGVSKIEWPLSNVDIGPIGQEKLRLQNSGTYMIWGNGPEGFGIGVNQTPVASSLFSLSSTTQGFLTSRMSTIQQDAIPTPAESLILYNTDQDRHNYQHPSDGWVPIGRYSGNVFTGGSAAAGQVQGANLDGELVAGRISVTGAAIDPLNASGVATNDAVALGQSSLRYSSIYGSEVYANEGSTQGYRWVGNTSQIWSATGTGGGINLQANTGRNKLRACATVDKGVLLTDTTLSSSEETGTHIALQLSGNGLMNLPDQAGATIEALTSFGSLPNGTVVNVGTGNGTTLNAVGLWFKKAGTWTFIA